MIWGPELDDLMARIGDNLMARKERDCLLYHHSWLKMHDRFPYQRRLVKTMLGTSGVR